MKNLTQLFIGILLVSFNYSQAQVELDAVNISNDYKYKEIRYYYYPNLQAYFDTKVAMYLYKEQGEWVESETLAPTTMGYSLKNGQYVMIEDYTGDEPYTLLEKHKAEFPAEYGSRPKKPTPKTNPVKLSQHDLAAN